jgi:nitrate reductase molybdenum cofactor assembly chaperone NarJ/NarW
MGGGVDSAVAAKAAALLLRYPDQETLTALAAMRPSVAQLPASLSYPLGRVIVHRASTHPGILGAEYVELFEFRGPCRLHLSYYTDGGPFERARALLRFAAAYQSGAGERPDFLPAVLDLAANSGEPGWALLREHRFALDLLAQALQVRGSLYWHVVHAIRSMLPQRLPPELEAAVGLARVSR